MKLRPFFSVDRGMFVSVDGPSGAGKSTIVRDLLAFAADAAGLSSPGLSGCLGR